MSASKKAAAKSNSRKFELRVNGSVMRADADPEMPLLWALRDRFGLRGTKYGCGTGLCGACLVLIDGEPNHACMVPLKRVGKRAVTTIEGLAAEQAQPIVAAWVADRVPQCGYCQPAQIVAASALLADNAAPDAAAMAAAMDGVLCRCGTYQRIRRAITGIVDGRMAPAPESPAGTGDVVLTEPEGIVLNDWVSIEPDNTVVLMVSHSEMGQGALNAVATLIAEELEVDLEQVHGATAPAHKKYVNPSFGTQLTGGSSTVRGEWERLRLAGATAREQLIRAAAEVWDVDPRDCRARSAVVEHAPTSRRLPYSELAARAAAIAPPPGVELKSPREFRLIGRAASRADFAPMVRGAAEYGMDVVVPDMAVAVIERSPMLSGQVKSFDKKRALAVPGVSDVVEISSGVAVVGQDFWSASQGRAALEVDWEQKRWRTLDTAAIYASLERSLETRGKLTVRRGAAVQALKQAANVVEARYRTPYLAHCTIEPPNCIADVRRDGCEIWVGTQDQSATQEVAARLTGLGREQVKVHTTFLGGGFGRRLETDFVAEAVELSAKLKRPVQVVWTREDDLRHDRFRPAHAAWLKVGIDKRGLPTAWWQRIAGPPVSLGMSQVPYAVEHFREEKVTTRSPVPVGAWRGVGAVQNAFAIESFVDELAQRAGEDSLDYRLALLQHSPRHCAVLEAAAEMIGWSEPAPAGRGRGIAVYQAFGSWTAQAAEVSIEAGGKIRVHRIACAIDCGQALNPDTVHAQVEGGIALGLSAALKEEIGVTEGRIAQSTLTDYPILSFSEMPEVDVRIIAGGDTPGGVGEPPVPLVAPAVANAVFAVTGKRLRSLPLRL